MIDETTSRIEDPKAAREAVEEMDRLLDEPILGITSAERMDEIESESFDQMFSQFGSM